MHDFFRCSERPTDALRLTLMMEPMEYDVTSTTWLLLPPETDNVTDWNATTGRSGSGSGGGRRSLPDDGHTRILFYAIIFVLAVAGNALVIATLALDRRMRTVTNLFLMNLAVSDLLLAVLCMPFTLIPTLLRNFIFGKAMCVLIRYMQGATNDSRIIRPTAFMYVLLHSMIGYCHHLVVRLSVRPSVCNAVHCGSQGRCTWLKVVPACS